MMKPKKRLSAGMGFSADGIDPLFEFDVPRLFVDLTLPPRYVKAAPSISDTSLHTLLGHDPWFDLVHKNHSRPTEEFLAEQQAEQTHSHVRTSSGEHTTSTTSYADGEKENAGGGGGGARLKRRNVAYRLKADTAPVSSSKATMRSVSAASTAAATVTSTAKPAKKKTPFSTTKLPFGNSTTPSAKVASSSSAHTLPRKRPVSDKTKDVHSRNRITSSSSSTSTTTAADKDLQDLQALLAKHNKKFKSNHTYEPRQHSVRDVRQWEKQTQKSYYKLSSDDRIQANAEIAQLVQARST